MTNGVPQRIADKFRVDESSCWLWTAGCGTAGYGMVWWKGKTRLAHRVVYELLGGSIPEGLQLDHLCRVRPCVNPAHLRPVTIGENVLAPGSLSRSAINARKTHCPQGHAFDERNTGRSWGTGRPQRYCRACHAERARARYAAQRAS